MSRLRGIREGIAGILLVLVAAAPVSAAAWWNNTFPYRRLVRVKNSPRTNLPGYELAVVTFPTGGKIQGDGSDIRVASSNGTQRPCRVLMVGPGDQVRIAFALQPGAREYYVYYGNPEPLPPKPLEIRRGVLLETWAYPGGAFATLEQVRKLFERDKQLIGRGFRDRIFLGYNPFGPQSRIVSRFTAHLIVTKTGEYAFGSTSQNASFVFVDDKLAFRKVQPRRRPTRRIRPQGTVELNAGLHKLTVYHVNPSGDPVVVAAWKPPGEKHFRVIPLSAFAQVHRAEAGPMERYGRAGGIDFIPKHAGETFLINRYFQRYRFEGLKVGRLGQVSAWKWDFGDGQTSAGSDVRHVYLVPGEYTVTLEAKTYLGELTRTNRIYVSRPWDRVTQRRIDGVRQHARIVAEYDFGKLGAEANAQTILLFKRAGMSQALLSAGAALVTRPSAPPKLLQEAASIYADALIADGDPLSAADALTKCAEMTTNPTVRASLLVRAARTYLDRIGDADRAMELFEHTVKRYAALTTGPAIQQGRIGLGDVWRIRGDYTKAAKAYAGAAARRKASPPRVAVSRGDFARHVEEYIRTRNLDTAQEYLDRWAAQFPEDKLEGYWSLLRVKMLMVQHRWEEAAREAEILTGVNPSSSYAAELLMMAGEGYQKLQEPDKAAATFRRIVTNYPESPLAPVASKKLEAGE